MRHHFFNDAPIFAIDDDDRYAVTVPPDIKNSIRAILHEINRWEHGAKRHKIFEAIFFNDRLPLRQCFSRIGMLFFKVVQRGFAS